MSDPNYPLPAFAFSVSVPGFSGNVDTAFREVSGLNTEMQLQALEEGGENRFVHQLPKGVKQGRLTLKRGVMPVDSELLKWCEKNLEGDLSQAIEPMTVLVSLLDAEQNPIRTWTFAQAYPVRWELEALNATKNEVAVERIDLVYQYSQRVT